MTKCQLNFHFLCLILKKQTNGTTFVNIFLRQRACLHMWLCEMWNVKCEVWVGRPKSLIQIWTMGEGIRRAGRWPRWARGGRNIIKGNSWARLSNATLRFWYRFLCMALKTYAQTKNRYARCHIRPCRAIFFGCLILFLKYLDRCLLFHFDC